MVSNLTAFQDGIINGIGFSESMQRGKRSISVKGSSLGSVVGNDYDKGTVDDSEDGSRALGALLDG